MMQELLTEFPWGEDVEFHNISSNTLCATFVSDAEEICVDGTKVHVDVETPENMPPPPEWLYDISRIKFFAEHVVEMRRKQYPDADHLPTPVDIVAYFNGHIKELMQIHLAAEQAERDTPTELPPKE